MYDLDLIGKETKLYCTDIINTYMYRLMLYISYEIEVMIGECFVINVTRIAAKMQVLLKLNRLSLECGRGISAHVREMKK